MFVFNILIKDQKRLFNSPKANCLQQRFAIAPLQHLTSLFKRTAETQRTQRVSRKVAKDSTFPPISFFNKPRRREEHEGRGEESANFTFSSQVSLFAIKYVILLGNFLNVTKL